MILPSALFQKEDKLKAYCPKKTLPESSDCPLLDFE
jgi:hypothetical protein